MTLPALTDLPIARIWPPQHPDRLQLYSLPTPNGVKVSLMLEETGLPYEAHTINISDPVNDQMRPEYLELFPNNKIPGIVDPDGPGGQPLALFESGAILVYLADKTGRFLARDGAARYETLQWLMWQMGGVGPMFGQVGFFYRYAGKDFEDKRPRDRYVNETRRLLGVLDRRLEGRSWIMGEDYTIADMAVFPWVRTLRVNYEAQELLRLDEFQNVQRVQAVFEARPAMQRAVNIPPRP